MTEKKQQVETQDDGFTSTKGSGNTWDPKQSEDKIPYAAENRSYDATAQPNHKEKDILIGYWVNKKDGVGKHGSSVVTIQDKDNVKHDVWLDTVLTGEFEKIPSMNILVKIEWLGTGLKKNMKEGQKGATYNKWSVGYKVNDVLAGAVASPVVSAPVAETETDKNPQSTKKTANIADGDDLPF